MTGFGVFTPPAWPTLFFSFFLFLFFRFCHVSCNNSFRSGLNRPLFSLVMHGSDPLSIILKKKTPPPSQFYPKPERSAGRRKKEKKKMRDLTMYTLSIREGEGEVAGGGGGGGGWGVGGGCRMEYALVCAGKLPVLPRCYRCKKDLRP